MHTSTAPMTAAEQAAMQSMLRTMRKQRIQDFFFHKTTMIFALSVLAVLLGIIFSLMVGAWPAFKEFGPAFITTVEWDPVNDQYGAMIGELDYYTHSDAGVLDWFRNNKPVKEKGYTTQLIGADARAAGQHRICRHGGWAHGDGDAGGGPNGLCDHHVDGQ